MQTLLWSECIGRSLLLICYQGCLTYELDRNAIPVMGTSSVFYAHHRTECKPKEPNRSECDLTPNGLKLRAQGRASSKLVDGRKNKLLQKWVLWLHQGGQLLNPTLVAYILADAVVQTRHIAYVARLRKYGAKETGYFNKNLAIRSPLIEAI